MRPDQCGTFLAPEDMHPDDRAAVEAYRDFLSRAGQPSDRCDCGGFDGREHHPAAHDPELVAFSKGER